MQSPVQPPAMLGCRFAGWGDRWPGLGGPMSNGAPTLHPSGSEAWQYAQAIAAISGLSARVHGRMRLARQRQARLAFTDAEHAARLHEARQLPVIRLMSGPERASWHGRVPAGLAGRAHAERCTVWTAQLADDGGAPTGEWGLEAHIWDQDAPSEALLVVCRDPRDALALTRQLRETGSPELLRQLHAVAASARPVSTIGPGSVGGPRSTTLGEADWAGALRRRLPAGLAERVIVTDPTHPHHVAWRELHALVDAEVRRLGADPMKLAGLVASIPRWRGDVRNPPALAHWALTEARRSPSYLSSVIGSREPGRHTDHRPRLAHLRAQHLHPDNPLHRLEAELQFGRHGSAVDGVLAGRFPDLTERATTAAAQHRAAQPGGVTADGALPVDSMVLTKLVDEVERLDPSKAIDRRAAHIMLGRVPSQIDQLLAAKFGHDPRFAQRLRTIYPAGIPGAEPRPGGGPPTRAPAADHSARRHPSHSAAADQAGPGHRAARPAPADTRTARSRRA